ncbi:putative transmembrane protein, partial [Ascoidea rubescens DSM 1968]
PLFNRNSLFGWIITTVKINENDILLNAGLDAFVFLKFFKMSIKILSSCFLLAFFIISPIRYHYTGKFDNDDNDNDGNDDDDNNNIQLIIHFLWTYLIFTYLFTLITFFFLFKDTNHILHIRQLYLGNQNSITDRTILLSGIPPNLRNESILKNHIELLNIGRVDSVILCKEWNKLNNLFKQRKKLIHLLEIKWAQYLNLKNIKTDFNYNYNSINNSNITVSQIENDNNNNSNSNSNSNDNNNNNNNNNNSDDFINYTDNESDLDNISTTSTGVVNLAASQFNHKRPKIKIGRFGLFGKEVDAIDHLSNNLEIIDDEIRKARNNHYSPTPTAFITMDTVASAQMAAQAVLDPHVNFLITKLAPAPHDIIWDHVCLSRKERIFKEYNITIIIGILSIALIFPVSYLATLLNIKTISKFWPGLGELLHKNKWAENFVTSLLPTYLFTLLNFAIPFVYCWLSSKQGFISYGEQELSIVSKNFFYIFINLFLVFTLAGTASNYWGFLSDTTKIAKQLSMSLKEFSLFYVDLIIFQGIGMFPFRLLLIGSLIRFPFSKISCKTSRDHKNLYKSPIFNFGLSLPQPMLILIITLMYSVISTKILASGVVYFMIGYFVYKYQLMYSMVHPPHSTGKVWPIIFRRIILGLLLLQLTMAGTLALQNAYVLATCLAPLPVITIGFLYEFQRRYLPLSNFIALRAIKNDELEDNSLSPRMRGINDDDNSLMIKRLASRKTLDERREQNQTYEYPYLFQPLDGPWISIEGDQIIMANNEGTIRKRIRFLEW